MKNDLANALERLRAICGGFGAPTWFVRGKASFVTYWPNGHHDIAFAHLWCAAPPGAQEELVSTEPSRFFRPPYVGGRGWLGVRLDIGLDWDEISAICADAYRTVAPRRLTAMLDAVDPPPS